MPAENERPGRTRPLSPSAEAGDQSVNDEVATPHGPQAPEFPHRALDLLKLLPALLARANMVSHEPIVAVVQLAVKVCGQPSLDVAVLPLRALALHHLLKVETVIPMRP